MPKLKPDETEQQNRVFRSVIACNEALYDITDDFLAKKLGVSLRTFRSRVANPETFSNGDERILIKVLHISKEQWEQIGGF